MHRSFRTLPRLAWTALAVALIATAAPQAQADDQAKLKTKWGEFEVSLRYRFESVSDDNPKYSDDALASTIRTAVLYRTPAWKHFSAYLQFEDVTDLGASDKHDNLGQDGLGNGVTDRPVIPDPALTEVNQVALKYTGIPAGTVVQVGRFEINLNNQRYVGAVGWRQHHQTFDAFRVTQKPTERIQWSYAFVGAVNRVVGDTQDMSSHLLDGSFRIAEAGTLTPYVYYLDYDDPSNYDLSTATYGARWQGRPKLGDQWSLPYHAEYAKQSDSGNNPADVDADYYRVEFGGARPGLWFKVGLEVLGGSPADGRFLTPLATLHKFNGWADKFLVTPDHGLQDLYVAAGGNAGPIALLGVFHDFSADTGGADYGTEFDLQASYKSPWKQVFAAKIATYSADDYAYDTFKAWIWTSYAF